MIHFTESRSLACWDYGGEIGGKVGYCLSSGIVVVE